MSALSREEMEVIICWNLQDKLASIEVPINTPMHRRLEATGAKYIQSRSLAGEEVSRCYEVPASWVKINPPRQLSEEQREQMAASAKARFHHTSDIL